MRTPNFGQLPKGVEMKLKCVSFQTTEIRKVDLGFIDTKNRRIGTIFVLQTCDFIGVEDTAIGHRGPSSGKPGTYFSFYTQATRDGEIYLEPALFRTKYFISEGGRETSIREHLVGLQRRAEELAARTFHCRTSFNRSTRLWTATALDITGAELATVQDADQFKASCTALNPAYRSAAK